MTKTVKTTIIYSEVDYSAVWDHRLAVTATIKTDDKPNVRISAGEDSITLPLADAYCVSRLLTEVLSEIDADIKPKPGVEGGVQ